VLLAVDARDIANSVDGHDDTKLVKVSLAVCLQVSQRVDERQAHGAWAEDILLEDVTLGGVGAVDTIVEFHDEAGAARQRLELAFHTYIIPDSRKKSMRFSFVESITYIDQ